jgi:peptidoglycan hydrolase CwlO-like protein
MVPSPENDFRERKVMPIDIERIAKLEAQVEGIKTDVADVKQDIKELHSRITTGNREIMDKLDEKIDELAESDKAQHEIMSHTMNEIKKRVDILENWRWMIVGGAIVFGYVTGHMGLFAKIFG